MLHHQDDDDLRECHHEDVRIVKLTDTNIETIDVRYLFTCAKLFLIFQINESNIFTEVDNCEQTT